MTKYFFLFFFMSNFSWSQEKLKKTKRKNFNTLEYKCTTNKKAIIFLHGSLKSIQLGGEYTTKGQVLEGNKTFIQTFIAKGYDIYFPLANKNFSWLTKEGCTLISQFPEELKAYDELILAGFSDGGTATINITYNFQSKFTSFIIFNGYPQHKSINQRFDYSKNINKPILFCSSFKDKVIPYEFMLSIYRRERINNPLSYFYLVEGGHLFKKYTKDHFILLIDLLEKRKKSAKIPIDGFVVGNKVEEVYTFRKKIGKKYHFNILEYEEQNIKKGVFLIPDKSNSFKLVQDEKEHVLPNYQKNKVF